MSANLRLEARDSRGTVYSCNLKNTPSHVTSHCLGTRTSSRHSVLTRYFKWLEASVYVGRPGELLDHKIEVLMFISEHPESVFYGA